MRMGIVVVSLVCTTAGFAHDVWVQTNTNIIRTGDAVHIDLMLGNHGNDHRDFKIASKVSAESIQVFGVRAPNGKIYDLKPDALDLGYAPKEGFHTAKFVAGSPGVYVAYQTADVVVNHGKPIRSVRSAKAFFQASDSLDKVSENAKGFEAPLGHPLELVPTVSPVAPMGPGKPIAVQLLFSGKPLAGVKVSFIPRGVALKSGLDAEYEMVTDAKGRASFTPKTGNYYLVVARRVTEDKGDKFEGTQYVATMTVLAPEKCPCCGE